jgi:hypothetical protein
MQACGKLTLDQLSIRTAPSLRIVRNLLAFSKLGGELPD